jgi:hypothetical protein
VCSSDLFSDREGIRLRSLRFGAWPRRLPPRQIDFDDLSEAPGRIPRIR